MPILVDNPIVTPPEPEKVYGELAVRQLLVEFTDPNGSIAARVVYGVVARDEKTLVGEYHATFAPVLHIPDLMAEVATDDEMAQVFNAVVAKLAKLAATRGIVQVQKL